MSRATGYMKAAGLARRFRIDSSATRHMERAVAGGAHHPDAIAKAVPSGLRAAADRAGAKVERRVVKTMTSPERYMDYAESRGVTHDKNRQGMIKHRTLQLAGMSKAGEEAIIPTDPGDALNRVVENEHPHGRFSRLRHLWSKMTGSDPVGLKKEAFSRLDAGRRAVKRGLMPSFHINDLLDLNDRAVSVPKTMQLQMGKGPIVKRETQWKKMTERGGRFSDAQEHLSGQVMKHVPAQETDKKYVAFKKTAGSKGMLSGLSEDLAKDIIQGRIAKKQALKGLR